MIYVALEPADDLAFVLIRASANPNPERKPPMRVARATLPEVLELLIDTAVEVGTC
ncbi:hypothetical protein [Ralstonia solanacearum]|uniref:hypothetical protein n=1 Tax=Ralstonia solanacearum TaxID=305 RepID=UPI0001D93E53|nr:hypothetical protein [Ralstonia solanacearum]CBJ42761.1 conserved protein of unknown function [Ralstonia solanacearum CFBP2957]